MVNVVKSRESRKGGIIFSHNFVLLFMFLISIILQSQLQRVAAIPTTVKSSESSTQSQSQNSYIIDDTESLQENVEDYPSDTHTGAVRAFSQLVADDSRNSSRSSLVALAASSSLNVGDDDISSLAVDVDSTDDENKKSGNLDTDADTDSDTVTLLELEDDHHSSSNDDNESIDSQYLIEELYYYSSYDEALADNQSEDEHDDDDGDDDFTDK